MWGRGGRGPAPFLAQPPGLSTSRLLDPREEAGQRAAPGTPPNLLGKRLPAALLCSSGSKKPTGCGFERSQAKYTWELPGGHRRARGPEAAQPPGHVPALPDYLAGPGCGSICWINPCWMSDLALPRKSLREIAPVPQTPPDRLSQQLPRGSERNQELQPGMVRKPRWCGRKEAMGRGGKES